MAPKLTQKHIDLPAITAMRVNLAPQVLSHSVMTTSWNHLHNEFSMGLLMTNRLSKDCLEYFFPIIHGCGGHRGNPDAEQFRAEHHAIAMKSLFIYSKGGNCRSDLDVFLLKLSNVTRATIPQGTRQKNTVSGYLTDLLAVARAPPQLSVVEDNIVVYIAGYLVKRATKKFMCVQCARQEPNLNTFLINMDSMSQALMILYVEC